MSDFSDLNQSIRVRKRGPFGKVGMLSGEEIFLREGAYRYPSLQLLAGISLLVWGQGVEKQGKASHTFPRLEHPDLGNAQGTAASPPFLISKRGGKSRIVHPKHVPGLGVHIRSIHWLLLSSPQDQWASDPCMGPRLGCCCSLSLPQTGPWSQEACGEERGQWQLGSSLTGKCPSQPLQTRILLFWRRLREKLLLSSFLSQSPIYRCSF